MIFHHLKPNILILLSFLFCFFSCKTKQEKFMANHHVLKAKTKEFEKFILASKIKPDEARELMNTYIIDNNLGSNVGGSIYFILDGHYTFTSNTVPKIPSSFTGGIWVNANNGDVKHVKEGVHLRAFYKYESNN